MKARLRLAGTVLLLFALVAGCTFYWNPLWVNDRQIHYRLWRAGVRSEYVNVQGNRIHTFEAVPPDGTPGKPLLLLHGLGSRGEDWAPLAFKDGKLVVRDMHKMFCLDVTATGNGAAGQ